MEQPITQIDVIKMVGRACDRIEKNLDSSGLSNKWFAFLQDQLRDIKGLVAALDDIGSPIMEEVASTTRDALDYLDDLEGALADVEDYRYKIKQALEGMPESDD